MNRREPVAFPGYALAFLGLILAMFVAGVAAEVVSTSFALIDGFFSSLTLEEPTR